MNGKQREIVREIIEATAGPAALKSQEIWTALDDADLPTWVDKCRERGALPIYELRPNPIEIDRAPAHREVFEASGLVRINIRLPDGISRESDGAQALRAVVDGAFRRDERAPERLERPASDFVVDVLGSRLPDVGLPVLGPGGRLTTFAFRDGLQLDVTMRNRTARLDSSWRSGDDIVHWIRRRILAAGDGLPVKRLRGAFGYFELSKYQRQRYMRPAFVVAADLYQPPDTPLWTSFVVEAATESPELPIGAGLGDWAT
jgi:hypothetical protein